MGWMNYIKTALANVMTAKLRSSLTLLGILVGTGSVVALVSSGQLATEHALAQFKTLGTDLLAVTIQDQLGQSQQTKNQLTVDQAGNLSIANAQIESLAPYTFDYANIFFRGKNIGSSLVGVTQQMQNIAKIELQTGRFISDLDGYSNFAVIGADLAEKTQLPAQQLIGKQIRVSKNVFTIVGVAKKWPENFFVMADINQAILIPIQSSFLLSKYVSIQNILFKLTPQANISQVENSLEKAINAIVSKKQIFFRSAEELIDSMAKQQQTFTLMLGSIGGISLLVGGIGVMNIMLVSVIERRREIGVRMAVGAKRKQIRLMFLIEAVVLTVLGGVLGIIIGIIASFIIAETSGWEFHLFLLPPTIGFLVSMLVGIFFGYYPAYKASKLDPITSLRTE